MINGSQSNDSLLIHLVNVVNKLTTQHAVDMKEIEKQAEETRGKAYQRHRKDKKNTQ